MLHRKTAFAPFIMLAVSIFGCPSAGLAQEARPLGVDRDSLIAAAREIIGLQKYCALVTIDSTGSPVVRTMNPFPPEGDMTVWLATNSRSRKAEEIRRNPSVGLYYADHARASGYVYIKGKAYLVDDMQEKLNRKREYWTQAFPDWKYLLLIKIVPERIEVINYKRGFVGESVAWDVPAVEFQKR
jgi:general stress protein 26